MTYTLHNYRLAQTTVHACGLCVHVEDTREKKKKKERRFSEQLAVVELTLMSSFNVIL